MAVSSTADGSVVLSVDFNISDAEKELAKLKTRVLKLEDEVVEKIFTKNTLEKRLNEAKAAYAEFAKAAKVTESGKWQWETQEEYEKAQAMFKQIQSLESEIEKINAAIDKGNISLEWTKQRYGEIAQEAERLRSEQQVQTSNPALKVADELKSQLQSLEEMGKWFGDKEYDEVYGKLLHINEVVRDHKREIMQANAYMEEMADSAGISDQRVADLGEELASLQSRMRELKRAGIGFGHQEYDEAVARIAEINQEIKDYKSSLLSAASDDYFQELADSAHVADEYITNLGQELTELKKKKKDLESAGLGLGVQEYDDVVARIEAINRELKEYKKSLNEVERETAPSEDQEDVFDEVIEGAEIASHYVVGLCKELEELKAVQKELEGVGIGLGYQEYDDNAARIAEITKELKEYQKTLSDTKPPEDQSVTAKLKAAEKMGSILEKLSKSFGGVGSIGAEAASTAEGLSAATAGMEGLTASAAAAGPVVLGVVAALTLLKLAADKIAEEAKKLVQSFIAGLQMGLEVLKKFGKAAVKSFQLAAEGALALLDKVNVFPKMFSSIGKSLTKLGQMIRRVFIFSVITSGLRAIRTQMTAYLGVNAQFSAALQQLKGVLLTAFQPIYDMVVPALTVLINLLSRAVAAVTQFTAVLFGTTAKQAQKNAQALYNQANATEAAGSAAEEASNQLAAFDEINKLQDESSAGGGGSAAETGPLFDWDYEDTPFPDWGEAFDAFLDKLLGNIPKLKEAFKNFADWLNNLAQKLYDMFTFPGVLDKVKQLGRDLADALNYLADQINWELLGRALGAGLNLALNFLTSFLYAFDWVNLGRHLAEFVNGLVYEIDWYEFGRLLWSGYKIGLETLAGFILGLDMPALADAASKTVMGFFDEMLNTIQRIPWGEIGAQIAEFLVNLDWYGMLSSVTSAIAAGLMAAVATVRGFLDRIVPELDRIAQEIVQALVEFFRDKVEWDEMARTIGDGIAAALHFVADLLDPELFYEIGKAIGDFFINLQWVEIFGGLTEALANGINAAIAALKGFLDSVTPEKLKEIADGIAQKINEFVEKVEWADLGQTISRGIEAAIDFLLELMDQIDWDAVGDAVATCLQNIEWDTLLDKWGTLLGEVMTAKMKVIDLSGAVDIGLNIVKGIAKGMWDEFNAGGGIIGWLKRTFVDKLLSGFCELCGIASPSTVFAEYGGFLIAGLANGLAESWTDITDFFGEKLDALKQNLSEAWENMKTTASEKWSEIKEALGAKWDEIRENAKTKFDEVKEKVGEVWENIKIEAPQKWEEIKGALATAWDNVKTSADEKFTNIKESIIDIMGKLKDHDWKGIGSTIMNGIWDGLKSIWDSITTWAGKAADWLGSAFSNAKSAVSSIVSGSAGGSSGRMAVQSIPDATAYRIPALAQGAVIPPNREFMAVLGDQSHGNNLEAPENLIRKIVREEAGGDNTALLEAILEAIKAGQVIMMDGKSVTKGVVRNINTMTRQSGRSVVLG